jgi:hypothetical protein
MWNSIKQLWAKWNEMFYFPIAILIFVSLWNWANIQFGENDFSSGLQPLGYYLGPLFFRPTLFILAGFMCTFAMNQGFPGLLDHTLQHIQKVINPAFQAWGTDKRKDNLEMDEKWAIEGLRTWLWLYSLAVACVVLATA